MVDLYARVSAREQADLGKDDPVSFLSASGQGRAEKLFFNKQTDNFRNDPLF